nr:acyl-CoA dehydrogenase family protein [Streptomyces sp. DSM 41633]
MKRLVLEAEHEAFRDTVRQFIERELVPNAEKWETDRIVDRKAYTAAGEYGLIGFNMPEEFGGGGVYDYRFNAVIDEEIARYGGTAPALSLQNDVV